MDARDLPIELSREPDEEAASAPTDGDISVHRTTPERFVFTETGNCDGWIATDLAVELRR